MYVLDSGMFLAKHLKGPGVPGQSIPEDLECFDVLVGRARPLPFLVSSFFGPETKVPEIHFLLFEPNRFAMKFQDAITDIGPQKFTLEKPPYSHVMSIDFGLWVSGDVH
mmetsp:Transcript_13157/g.34967  ORF Transcript_13157/g.34967 Transcript_13157/m.34967 type:complete len:109 (+) Transcript_13157:511-837(+)